MVNKLAGLFFLIFSTASPKPLFLNNNSSMDTVEVNPNTSTVVPFKSNIPLIKTSSFSTKLNPLPVKPKVPIFKEPLSEIARTGQSLWQSLWMEPGRPLTTSYIFVSALVFFGIFVIIVVHVYALLLSPAGCVNQ